jgi:hypothetical protein
MTINLEKLKDLEPCEDRLENYVKHYETWEGTFSEFLELEMISDLDKVWVFAYIKEIPDNIKRRFAVWCVNQCKTEVNEINEFQKLIAELYESTGHESIEHMKDDKYRAADRAAYWAAYGAADSAAERKKQVEKIKELLEVSE